LYILNAFILSQELMKIKLEIDKQEINNFLF